MPRVTMAAFKAEREYLKRVRSFADQVILDHPDADQEGFAYFDSEEYRQKHPKQRSRLRSMLLSGGPGQFLSMLSLFAGIMGPMMRGRNACFTDLDDYLKELEETGIIGKNRELPASYPNQEIWDQLTAYAEEKWGVVMGFTEMPEQLIFRGKAVLFRYALVCIQEMDKDKIDEAPKIAAGAEVQRVYNSLGHAVNDIAVWLRSRFNIKCQSNHPLGGLVNTTPLAGKAGMGWQGCNGLLITPQFGQRQRIAPIFIENKLFKYTDNLDHLWIEDFCRTCQRCRKSCPPQAIYAEKKPGIQNLSGIGQTRSGIDREKCYPQFSRTVGCSICIKVCPFSQGPRSYEKIKGAIRKKRA